MVRGIFLSILFALSQLLPAQGKKIGLEEVWTYYSFYPSSFSGFNSMKDGLHYTEIAENGDLNKHELASGKFLETLVKPSDLKVEGTNEQIKLEDFEFSADEKKILIKTEDSHVYRRSAAYQCYVYDLKTKKLRKLSDKGKQMFPKFSPAGNKVAFVRDNNLFIKDLNVNTEIQITSDGEYNKIKNGWADWVYEEEFSKADHFCWNTDGTKLAYIKYNEERVKEFEMTMYGSLYPKQYKYKYPKAGEANSIVSVHIYDLKSEKTINADIGAETDIYIPRIVWTTLPNTLSIQRLNRLQNKLELLFANADNGTTKVILNEESKTYIDITDNLTFLNNNKGFIWSSEIDGYNHLYYYDMNGKLINQITKGPWDVMDFKGYDETTKMLYYISTESGAINRDLYGIDITGKKKKKLHVKEGTNDADFSQGFKYYVSKWNDANTPPVYELHSIDGKLIKVLEDNTGLKEKIKSYAWTKKEFFKFSTSENVELNGWMMKPVDFDASKKYPVFMFAYGGPGSNECNNQWEITDFPWHQRLCQEGYIVVCVDGRGTQGRGREFKHSTYLQLGKLETIDQIETAKYLGNQTYVDKDRIGFMGWSFGGYLSSLLISKGADYFKANIAVAPVTNWRYYDNIYTERFLRTPQENPKGYDDNSPINFVKLIKGKYLLIHGTADDNVHYQNAMEMADALIKNNIPFEMMSYPNKNHGIYGGNTRIHLFTKMLEFIKRNL